MARDSSTASPAGRPRRPSRRWAQQAWSRSSTPSARRLFGGQRGGGLRLTQPGEQGGFLRLGRNEVPLFDMSEAADLLGDGRQRGAERVVSGRQPLHDLLQQRLVLADQKSLGAALLGAAEDV